VDQALFEKINKKYGWSWAIGDMPHRNRKPIEKVQEMDGKVAERSSGGLSPCLEAGVRKVKYLNPCSS